VVIEEALLELRGTLGNGRTLVRTLVVLAPLAGLLGTVTGMIETFRSLADMALFTQGGGIAGGIAEALLTTQMGLAVSVPGLVVGRALDLRESSLQADLDLLTELVCSRPLSEIGVPKSEVAA
jgi:biopolymer transport protein ExbB